MKARWRSGEPFIWLTGGALALALLLVAGLVGLILYNGLGFFWPSDVVRLTLSDGKVMTGQLVDREAIPGQTGQHRVKVRVANRDLYGADFQWVDEALIARREWPCASRSWARAGAAFLRWVHRPAGSGPSGAGPLHRPPGAGAFGGWT